MNNIWLKARTVRFQDHHFDLPESTPCKFHFELYRDAGISRFLELPLRMLKDVHDNDYGCSVCIKHALLPKEIANQCEKAYGDWAVVSIIRPPRLVEMTVKVLSFRTCSTSEGIKNIVRKKLSQANPNLHEENGDLFEIKVE